ncbi:agglutinin biogenesis protein MshQ [Alteromonas sp. BL110]|uniref:H-type lectin domain-containing protein n=1 Tax=Alteromonas sp. BL110 TaxID=1714845 RepID=UPI000E4C7647|nr:H-type lectin domain-containing protein [Alteromonas sp. BL110]AXT38307.1 agglutinin biogenesis protein MshQ [Alteromonas sp. BL110]RKM83949.1 agglutinin biogenesis protein MshQ [Alteromonas sp. BL110]
MTHRISLFRALFIGMLSVLALPVLAVPQIEGRFIELQNTYNKAEWTTISFSQVYDEPPAVFMLSTNQGGNPAIVKIRNVTRTGFEALPLEPSGEDGPHITMGGHYLAIAYGVHEFPDGDIVEVGKMEVGADTIQASVNSPWYEPNGPLKVGEEDARYAQVPLQTDFGEKPVFFHSLQTVNNQVDVRGEAPPDTYLLPYLTVAAKYDAIGSNAQPPTPQLSQAYFVALEASETLYEPVTRTETLAYMATTEGDGRAFFDDNGVQVDWEAFFADDQIVGWSDRCTYNFYRNNYAQTPLVAASKISRNGGDGGWLRSCGVNSNRLGLRVDEDRSLDSERNHDPEDASIIAMTSEFVFSGEFPSCEVAFPGALATFGGSEIYLGADSRVFDDNGGVLTTLGITSDSDTAETFPKCGENAVACFPSNTDALSESQARAIPSITIDDSGPGITPGDLAGDYYFSRTTVNMGLGIYNVIAPTRIYINDPGDNPLGVSTIFSMVDASINVADGAYLAIYVNGDVVIDGSNPQAVVLATGSITFVNVSGETIVGSFTAGGGIDSQAALSVQETAVPSNIPGICGREVIEVLNHYRFELADNRGSSCAAKEVTLKACADVNCDLLYSQSATVGLLPSSNNYTWAPSDSVTFIGQTSLTIDSLNGNDPTLATSGESPSSQLRCFIGGAEVNLNSCKVNFEADGLTFKNLTDNNDTLLTQLSGKPSDVGFNEKQYAIEACGDTDLLRNKLVDVELNYNCGSASTCSNKLVFENNGNEYELGTSSETFSLQFDDNSQAIFSIQYPDAGELSLSAEIADRSPISGSSNTFIVRPFGFALDILDDSGSATNPNGYANNANDSLLKLTGEDFILGIKSVQWVDGEDANDDGIPDNYGQLQNNRTAEHFSGSVSLSPTTSLPAGGATGTLAGAESGVLFDDESELNIALNYSEVGIISIAATSNYLASTTVTGLASNVGRFAPSNFTLSGEVTPACSANGNFTYFDQPLQSVTYTLAATNHLGSVTQNYFAGFDKLNAMGLEIAYDTPLTRLDRLINDDTGMWPQSGATGVLSVIDNDVIFTRLGSSATDTDGPFEDTSLVLTFASSLIDGATVNNISCDSDCVAIIDNDLMFAYGRATLINNYGGADEALLLPLRTQYWDGQTWRINTYDSCTDFAHANINDASGELVSSEDGTLNEGAYTTGEGMRLSSPNGAGNYSVTYTPDAWLLWDWDGDGEADNPPSATLTYGVYRGNDNIIYKREQINN